MAQIGKFTQPVSSPAYFIDFLDFLDKQDDIMAWLALTPMDGAVRLASKHISNASSAQQVAADYDCHEVTK
ncbi:MAG TPA: hypothetical protein VIW23_11320 [Candidatus Acidoferrum sp.]|jgi:hypothetical protein